MNLEELRAIQSDERGVDSPQALPDSFYQDVSDYLEELREQRAQALEESGDPFGSEAVRKLSDEIDTAEAVTEAIYERRVGKVVKQASLAAMGMSTDVDNLTTEESALFHDLVDRIETNRETVLSTVSGTSEMVASLESDPPESDPSAPPSDDPESPPPPEPAETESPQSSTPDEEPGPESDTDGDPEDSIDRMTIRMTTDVGEIFGIDERVYDLAADDIVTLPVENAQPLLDRDAAKRIE